MSLTNPSRHFAFALVVPLVVAIANFASVQQQILGSVQRFLGFEIADLPIVTISQASLTGVLVEDDFPVPVEAWLGVPYAQSPTGSLRFAKPKPVAPGNETFLANKFGPRCPGKQLLPPGGGPDIWSEDCLTANVFRPTNMPQGKKVPVMVYVHGGAFNRGTAKMHNTASMVGWATQPFVAVSFNYRIGALGFLNSELTHEEGLLNLGLWDQVLLLEWVRDNIAAFGGDAGDVTLVGLSAGAHSIGHHILNINTPAPLFHKAVIESGGPTSRALHPYDSALHETQFQHILKETGCNNIARSSILSCLRNVSEASIVSASNTVFAHWNPSVRWAWQPVIDGELIPRRPLDAWTSDNWNKVPILTGFNHNEGTMYVPKTVATSADFRGFWSTLLPHLSEADLDEIDALYPDPALFPESPYMETRTLDVGAQYKRLEAAYGHYAYVCPVRQTAIHATSAEDSPVYVYHWATNRTVLGGANHGDQMWYETFDPSVTGISDTQQNIAGVFHDYIVSFVLTGDPNAVEGRRQRPIWKAWGDEEKTMLFGAGNDERAGGGHTGTVAQLVDDTWASKELGLYWHSKKCACFLSLHMFFFGFQATDTSAKRVYTHLLCIPAGTVTSYAILAAQLSTSPRAIGGALRNNPFAPRVPCHRVIAANGFVGGFMGDWRKAPSGINQSKKLELLKEEGVEFTQEGNLVVRDGVWFKGPWDGCEE
ncbi:alpha/beta-hydrolase [Aureobasidium sp. EXF-10727]|nr:alpha/beta-hydrolase [Aureobasidium sp. EXF-10727]